MGVAYMRVCVVHNTLNSVGGGERVCLAVIEALKSLGHEITLVTTEFTDWGRVERIVGKVVRPDREVYLLPFRVKAFGIYMRLLTALLLAWERKKCDLVVNTHGDVLPMTSDILYMHFPTFALLRENPVNVKYSESLFWRLYFYPYEKMQGYLAKKMKWRILLTNSEFSREAIRKYIHADAIVVHPPVEISEFLKASENMERDDRVVSCGRYTPEKNYEFVLRVAEHLPHIEFTIIGASSGKVSNAYYRKLARIVEEKKLRNVKLLRDVPRSEQLEIYSRSKVFLHAMIGEHFGIAVVEGMAAGLVPIVHRSGGPWFDIVDRGMYGLGYENVDEVVKAVEYALDNYEYLREKAIRRAMMFSKERFVEKFKEIINSITSGE